MTDKDKNKDTDIEKTTDKDENITVDLDALAFLTDFDDDSDTNDKNEENGENESIEDDTPDEKSEEEPKIAKKRSKPCKIGHIENLISLRCPLVISSATLFYDGEGCKIKVSIDYPENATVRRGVLAVVMLVRALDGSGEPIPAVGGDVAPARQIKFGDDGLSVGESTEFVTSLEFADGAATPKMPDVSISSATFEDGSVADYLHGEFFVRPAPPTPLTKVFRAETVTEIKEKFGGTAEYLPSELSPIVWRCTCGEICQDETCPVCSLARADVFAYFGDTSSIAPRLSEKKKKILIGALIGLGALVLVELCIFGIMLGIKHAKDGDVTTEPPAQTTAPTTDPVDDPTAIVNTYIGLGNYRSALDYAKMSGLSDEFIADIVKEAVDYYGTKGDHENALYFAEMIEGYDLVPLYTKVYDSALVSGDYDRAYEIASKLGDDSKKNDAADSAIAAALRENDFASAMLTAQTRRAEKIDSVASAACEYYCDNADFDRALEYAAKSSSASGLVDSINKSAAIYYLGLGDFDRAIGYAEALGDTDLIKNTIEGLSNEALAKNMPAYFSYLSADRKRAALATTVSYGRYLACINSDGSVSYGAGETYTPKDGNSAVSVSVGQAHTVILLSNGRVVALGSNSLGQCDTSEWRGVVAISAGAYHTVALTADGKVLACGKGSSGQTKVSSLEKIVSVSAGGRHTLALTEDGKVIAVGDDGDGQCSTGFWSDVCAISAGELHSVALTKDGSVLACGSELSGRCDVGSLESIVSISAGKSMTVCVKSDGSVVPLGGVIGQGSIDTSSLSSIKSVYAGDFGFVAIKTDGSAISVGYGAPDVSGVGE